MRDATDYTAYRLEKMQEAFVSARVLVEASQWNAAVNRLYYCCFYAVSALLVRHNLSSQSHKGVRGLFNIHFVKTEIVPKDTAAIYNLLFEYRQEADYSDFVDFKEPDVRLWMEDVERFSTHISSLLQSEHS